MIKNIRLCLIHSGRTGGKRKIVFQPGFNVVVGPNGSGKSSLLTAIYACSDCETEDDPGTQYHYFNGELMNPHRSEEYFKGVAGSLIRVRAMFSSHGETMRDVLQNMKFKPGDCLLLDEPETGHDLGWVMKIRKGLDRIVQDGCQVIVASHHLSFFRHANVIELTRNYSDRTRKKFRHLVSGEEGSVDKD